MTVLKRGLKVDTKVVAKKYDLSIYYKINGKY